jgi:hypothetical protein
MSVPTEWFRWPLEETLSRRGMAHVEQALRDWLNNHDHDPELHNSANAIRAWLQKNPPKDDLLS